MRMELLKEVWRDSRTWLVRIFSSALILLVFVVLVVPLKWALGITNIEKYLEKLQSNLSRTEDTIFSFKYDYNAPYFKDELEVLRDKDIDLLEFFEYSRGFVGDFSKAEKRTLLTMKPRVVDSARRDFYFSAADNSTVFFDYEIKCFDREGKRYMKPIKFKVKVNQREVLPHNDWQGRKVLNEEDLTTHVNYGQLPDGGILKKHTMSLQLVEDDDFRTLAAVVERKIDRCTFDAMIFVRDVPEPFESESAASWVKERVNL